MSVQAHLWSELNLELHSARNGYWSIGIEMKLARIIDIAKVVGVTPPEEIPLPILASGLYNTVCDEFGIPRTDVHPENIAKAVKFPEYWMLTRTKIRQWKKEEEDGTTAP